MVDAHESRFDRALRGILHRPALLATALLVSVAAAGAAAIALDREQHVYEGKLLFVPNQVTSPYYQSPRLSSLVHVVLTPRMLETVRQSCDVDEDLFTLRNKLKLDVAEGDTLTLSIARPDPQQAEKIVNSVMDEFVAATREIRTDALARHLAGFQRDSAKARDQHQAALARQQAFLETHRLDTPLTLAERSLQLQQTIGDLDRALQTTRSQLSAAEAKRTHLGEVLGDAEDRSRRVVARKAVADNAEAPPADLAATQFPASRQTDLERRAILQDQIRRQQQEASYATRIRIKNEELARAKTLRERRLISQAEVDRIAGEIAVLEAEQNANVDGLVKAVDAIENRIALDVGEIAGLVLARGPEALGTAGAALGSAIEPSQMLALLDLEIYGVREQKRQLEQDLEAKRAALAELGVLQKEFAPLADEVRRTAAESERLQTLESGFRQAADSAIGEVTIVQAASPTFDAVTSNRNKVFAAALAAMLALTLGPPFASEWTKAGRPAK